MIRRSLAGIGTVLATFVPPVLHAQQSDQETPSAVEEVIVTGYRASLENAADAKRAATNFTDSIFAEDIGKFPDLNIAEALNRIPGIQLTREVNGDGLNIAIRGLNTNFTKTFLNGSQIAVASSGRTDAQNQNRELDLDLFPTELFTQLDVAKSPTASTIEGGLAGSVNMRSIRPFDNPDPGLQLSYQLQGGYGEVSEKYSPRGAFTVSWTNDTFGVLVGAAAVSNKSTTEGYETIGWTNPNLSWTQCNMTPPDNDPPIPPESGAGDACATGNAGGGNGWVIPATVPVNAGAGLNANDVIDDEFLLANNPGLSLTQIGEALIPRLSRPAYISGDRDRISGLVSFEYRPNERMHFYLDTLYSDADREFDRLDMDLVGRFGSIIPLNLQVDENNVVTSGTFANAQFFLEARPYHEEVDFYNINPGARFQFNDWIGVDFQVNRSRSVFFREAPTVLVNTPLNQGIVAEYRNTGGNFPTVTTNVDLNAPNLGWTWSGGRLNIQNERRVTETQGAHLDFTLGEPTKNVRFGLAYDDVSRSIRAFDNSARWEDVACRNGLDPDGNSPATDRAPCDGMNPNSAIPQSELASYLMPGPAGFITVDFDRFMAATDYHRLSATAPEVNSAATGANTGLVIERTTGAYIEFNTEASIMERPLRLNAGVRYIMTDQTIGGPVTIAGMRQEQRLLSDYDAFLPAFNAALDVTDNIVARMSASRTLTRNNPSAMLPNTVFSDPSAQNAAQGNPNLSPFLSTNLDLGAEWYTGGEGFVGLTLFAKQITGFTVLGTNTIPFRQLGIPFESLTDTQQGSINSRGGPDVAQVTVSQQVNAPGKLNLQGLELTWVQPLGQWVEALEGFGFNVNYTRVSQSAEGTGVPAQAIGISPHAFNTTAYYERGPASIRLSYVWNDDQISSGPNQNSIPIAQLRTDARGQLDLSASYEFRNLPTSPQLTLNIINITSEEQRQTFQYDNAAYTFYEPGFQILLGIRGKF